MASTVYPDTRAVAEKLRPSYPVYCLNLKTLVDQVQIFLESFPGRVLYAVKCNPHPKIIKTLYESGIRHFDTASLPEIAQVRESHRDAVAYFMNPVKSRAVIKAAYDVYGVRHFVVDHQAELEKTLDITGGEDVVVHVRLKTPEAKALYNLASKFGAPPDEAVELLRTIRKEGIRVGLAFHVGSQCLKVNAYEQALELCGKVIDQAEVNLNYLDIGGGFPAYYPGMSIEPLRQYFHGIANKLKQLGLRNDCVLMCEPGRALVVDCCSLLVQVLLRKDEVIYINDGIYGSLSELALTPLELPMRVIRLDGEVSKTTKRLKIFGPTCDSLDVLPHDFDLPEDIREGDWLEIGQIGAYSNAVATRFNGFRAETFVEVESILHNQSSERVSEESANLN